MTLPAHEPTDWTVPRAMRARASRSPDRPFVTMEHEGTETFAQCHAHALAMGRFLQDQGVQSGQVVAVMAPNSLVAIHAWMGLGCIGAVDAMINTGYRGGPLEHALNLVQASVLLVEERFLPVLQASEQRLLHLKTVIHFRLPDTDPGPLPSFERIALAPLTYRELAPDSEWVPEPGPSFHDLASVIFTSGTSGPAKGVMMPQAQAYALALQTVNGLRLEADDVYYCAHPLFHTAGKFIALYAALLAGAHVALDRMFRADLWVQRLFDLGATVTLAHGAMLEMVHAQPPSPLDGRLRLRRLMAAPFPRRIAAEFERRFGVRGVEVWGMTEVNNPCWNALDEPLHLGTCGRPDPAWAEMRVVDPETDLEMPIGEIGEFVVRPVRPFTMMQGYWNAPEATVRAWRNLWFHTGDAGYVDADGRYHFVDRLGDRIRRRAENIASFDIETAAQSHDGVRECAAVGVPSGYESDDDIKLFVALRSGQDLSPPALLTHMASLLPHYMVPRYIEIIDALPRTPTNKVRKSDLRAGVIVGRCWDRKAAGVSLRNLMADGSTSANRLDPSP
ncbi:MAG: ATP-dependent acyl-CoA ligase [Variovorax sp.]|nr:MAG: ATP-dependent acyl-CoA ligase [Variovorax sp.]